MGKDIVIYVICFVVYICAAQIAGAEEYEEIIALLDEQIEAAESDAERATLCCYKARNHLNNRKFEEAEQGYLEALEYSTTGWILHEYSRFLLLSGEYERAYRAASKVLEEFPQFKKEATSIKNTAKEEYEKAYLEAHPPTIIMNTEVDPHRITRPDLIRKARGRTQAVIYSGKTGSSSRKRSTNRTTVKRT